MLFTLKKFVAGFLQPLPLILLLMAVALFLLWRDQKQKTAKILLSCAWLLLLMLSLQPFSDSWLNKLEKRYPTYAGASSFSYIVVLGGGYTYNSAWAPSSNLINNSLARVTEGIRLYRTIPGSKLVFTGGKAANNPQSSAWVAAQVASSLGVPQQDIILLDTPKDTQEEALAVKGLLGKEAFLLVTSASHLPRAIQHFEKLGLKPTAAPANQLAIQTPLNFWERLFPSALYLQHSERAWYETMGSIWLHLQPGDAVSATEDTSLEQNEGTGQPTQQQAVSPAG